MKFIGDLSAQDAALLAQYASHAKSILEFGVGGSTQVIAQSIPADTTFVALETSPVWMEATRANLGRLGVANRVHLFPYDQRQYFLAGRPTDLVFVDSVPPLRMPFATESWPLLAPGGTMLFHDTRRPEDIANVAAMLARYGNEIAEVRVNEPFNGVSSNITAIKKKAHEPYVDWNIAEGRPAWMYGMGPVPPEFWSGR